MPERRSRISKCTVALTGEKEEPQHVWENLVLSETGEPQR